MQLTRSRVISFCLLAFSLVAQTWLVLLVSASCAWYSVYWRPTSWAVHLAPPFPPFFHSKISVTGAWFHWLRSFMAGRCRREGWGVTMSRGWLCQKWWKTLDITVTHLRWGTKLLITHIIPCAFFWLFVSSCKTWKTLIVSLLILQRSCYVIQLEGCVWVT